MKGFSSKRIGLKVDCYRTGKYTVNGRVRAYFSQEILQAGAMKGLSTRGLVKAISIVIIIIIDRSYIYIYIFSGVGQSHCTLMSHMILNE